MTKELYEALEKIMKFVKENARGSDARALNAPYNIVAGWMDETKKEIDE